MRVDAHEREAGRLTPGRLDEAVGTFESEGFVVLEHCIPNDVVTTLRAEYELALDAKIARFEIAPVKRDDPRLRNNDAVEIDFRPEGGNHDFNRWNMHLPSRHPFLDERVIANPIAMDVIDRILGEDAILKRIASDTALPHAGFQNIHRDLHGDIPTVQLALNVPLVDFTEENAPLEVWPRTHLWRPEDSSAAYSPYVRKWTTEQTAHYAKTMKSVRILAPAGTIIIRDTRVLHRGTPNRAERARPMLSLAYRAPPTEAPSRLLSHAAARFALALRERGRRGGRVDIRLLNSGNLLGRRVEALAGTDRDYRRPIPSDIWSSFSSRARRLLRFAYVEAPAPAPGLTPGAVKASIPLVLAIVATSWTAGAAMARRTLRPGAEG